MDSQRPLKPGCLASPRLKKPAARGTQQYVGAPNDGIESVHSEHSSGFSLPARSAFGIVTVGFGQG
jgi:hypothetical protein